MTEKTFYIYPTYNIMFYIYRLTHLFFASVSTKQTLGEYRIVMRNGVKQIFSRTGTDGAEQWGSVVIRSSLQSSAELASSAKLAPPL